MSLPVAIDNEDDAAKGKSKAAQAERRIRSFDLVIMLVVAIYSGSIRFFFDIDDNYERTDVADDLSPLSVCLEFLTSCDWKQSSFAR